jgi:hypothetical protein
MSDTDRLKKEYGEDAITKQALAQNRARYIVLTPDEMDDDDVIDLIEKSPTYKRKPDFRNQIKERQQTVTQERIVETPKVPKRPSSDSQTIDFGDN